MLDLLFPRRCVVCRRPGTELCAACRTALPRIPPPLCDRCGAPTVWPVRRCAECAGRRLAFGWARAALIYDGPARSLIRAWKEQGLRTLAPIAAELVVDAVPRPDAAALVAVPPDRDRRLLRGEHPATALARELAVRWRLPVAEPIVRTGESRRQAGLPRARRRANVRGAFLPTAAGPRSACLVDDVYTSGETINAAAAALRRAGTVAVGAVSLARAVR